MDDPTNNMMEALLEAFGKAFGKETSTDLTDPRNPPMVCRDVPVDPGPLQRLYVQPAYRPFIERFYEAFGNPEWIRAQLGLGKNG